MGAGRLGGLEVRGLGLQASGLSFQNLQHIALNFLGFRNPLWVPDINMLTAMKQPKGDHQLKGAELSKTRTLSGPAVQGLVVSGLGI